MNKNEKRALARWADALIKHGVDSIYTRRGGLLINGRVVDHNGARLISMHGTAGGKWIAFLGLPVVSRLQRLAYLRRMLTRRDIPYLTVDRNVINTAQIDFAHIEVVSGSRRMWGHFLIRARSSNASRWGYGDHPWRTSYYLAGWDKNEVWPSYFFCELPQGVNPVTIAEAYDALKPEAVKVAEQMGRKVRRQGDIFCIPVPTLNTTGMTEHEKISVLGTNHVADQVLHGGAQTYARGKLKHAPRGRRADHSTLFLGKTWHLVVKNTVPTVR